MRLPDGEVAQPEADCIRMCQRADGRIELNGTALMNCGDNEATESVSLVGGAPYATYEDAEAAGMAWADEHCVEVLHVTRLPLGSEDRSGGD